MKRIELLDQSTINKIAAGEVVERPASVVKELIENAIDAGATAITVEVKEGGLKLIRITDNGGGIPKNQVKTAFLRHSTSKIRQASDLNSIESLGFRGEALASIAAVSMVELITKEPAETTGIRYEIQGGKEKSFTDIGCPTGTTFVIKELFYNTPARLKFMKTPSTELGYVSDLVNRLALGHPEIAFKFVSNNKAKLQTAGKKLLKDCVYSVFGKDITRNLIEINGETEGIEVHGYIGKPHISRGNRTYENYFINGRYIKSKIIEKAIEDAFKSRLMLHRYPFAVFHMTINPEIVDVNVHPTKMDVRFMKEKMVYELVFKSVTAALEGRNMIPGAQLSIEKAKKPVIEKGPEPFEQKALADVSGTDSKPSPEPNNPPGPGPSGRNNPLGPGPDGREVVEPSSQPLNQMLGGPSKPKEKALPKIDLMKTKPADALDSLKHVVDPKKYEEKAALNAPSPSANVSESLAKKVTPIQAEPVQPATEKVEKPVSEQLQPEDTSEKPAAPDKAFYKGDQMDLVDEGLINPKSIKSHKVIGQLFNTYWIVELDEKYYIIDQHAAHEKVLYERMLKKVDEKMQYGQRLLKPVVVNLSIQEFARYEAHAKLFSDLGFEVEPFGDEAVIVRSVPFIFNKIFEVSQFTEILDALADSFAEDKYEMVLDELATMSCKAAVKGNDKLTEAEYLQLINDLMELDDPFHCPHGRPTIIAMTRYELEKKFKRIV